MSTYTTITDAKTALENSGAFEWFTEEMGFFKTEDRDDFVRVYEWM